MPNILIVDDEQSYRQLLSLVFEGDGNKIRTAMNGRQALELLEEEPADVIISDVKDARHGWHRDAAVRSRDTAGRWRRY